MKLLAQLLRGCLLGSLIAGTALTGTAFAQTRELSGNGVLLDRIAEWGKRILSRPSANS